LKALISISAPFSPTRLTGLYPDCHFKSWLSIFAGFKDSGHALGIVVFGFAAQFFDVYPFLVIGVTGPEKLVIHSGNALLIKFRQMRSI